MGLRMLSALAAVALLPALAAADPATDEAITNTALAYAEAWFSGDAPRMASVLHPEFLRRRIMTDPATGQQWMLESDAPAMVEMTEREGGRDDAGPLDLRVTILDRVRDMAVVRVVSPLYVDHLQMVRWKGRWVVLAALWGPLDE
ncbi:MAG: nuclear transport factor 2 family protein [Gammaproteobacteria bacterium]